MKKLKLLIAVAFVSFSMEAQNMISNSSFDDSSKIVPFKKEYCYTAKSDY